MCVIIIHDYFFSLNFLVFSYAHIKTRDITWIKIQNSYLADKLSWLSCLWSSWKTSEYSDTHILPIVILILPFSWISLTLREILGFLRIMFPFGHFINNYRTESESVCLICDSHHCVNICIAGGHVVLNKLWFLYCSSSWIRLTNRINMP